MDTTYRGYRIRRNPLHPGGNFWVERGGSHIGYFPTVEAARAMIDYLEG